MATQTVPFRASPGETVIHELFASDSDTVVSSVTATEATNRKGHYSADHVDVPAGEYHWIARVGSTPVASDWVTLLAATGRYDSYPWRSAKFIDASVSGIAASVWAVLTSTLSTAGTIGKLVTDTLTNLASMSEFVSSIWRFKSTALSQGPGGPEINLTPLQSSYKGQKIESGVVVSYLKEGRSLLFSVKDTDLTDASLEFIVNNADKTQNFIINSGITGAENQATVVVPYGSHTAELTNSTYTLRLATSPYTVYAQGEYHVLFAGGGPA
jgi:hypothetical protein